MIHTHTLHNDKYTYNVFYILHADFLSLFLKINIALLFPTVLRLAMTILRISYNLSKNMVNINQ